MEVFVLLVVHNPSCSHSGREGGGFCNVNSVNVDQMMLFISGAALLLLNSVNDRWTVGDTQINTVNLISKERKFTAGKSVSASKHAKFFKI